MRPKFARIGNRPSELIHTCLRGELEKPIDLKLVAIKRGRFDFIVRHEERGLTRVNGGFHFDVSLRIIEFVRSNVVAKSVANCLGYVFNSLCEIPAVCTNESPPFELENR